MLRIVFALFLSTAAFSAGPGIEKITAYAGDWTSQIEHLKTSYSRAGSETTKLHNDCWRSSGFYACNQIVNGESKALIVFTYDDKTGTYNSYPIPANGGDASHGKLIIKDNVWTFPWEDTDNGKKIYFRVVNVFTDDHTIEYRQEFSTDNEHWTVMAKGLEKKQ